MEMAMEAAYPILNVLLGTTNKQPQNHCSLTLLGIDNQEGR